MSKGHKDRKVARSRKKQEARQERMMLIARRQHAKRLQAGKRSQEARP